MKFLKENRDFLPLMLFVTFLPFSWASSSVGSLYRALTILITVVVLITSRGRFTIDSENRKTFLTFLVYMGYCALSFLWSPDAELGTKNAMGMLLLIIIAFIFSTTAETYKYHDIMLYCWIAVGIISACLYIFGQKTQVGIYGSRTSLMILGTPTDPNEYAGLFCITTSCSCIMLLKARKAKWKLILLLSIGIELYAVLMTGSRGALLSTLIALLATLFIAGKISIKTMLLAFGTIIILMLFFVNWVLPNLPVDILKRLSIEALLNDQGSGRSGIWIDALNQFCNGSVLNMLFGYGAGGISAGTSIVSTTMHNQFIQQLVNYGIIGFVLYVIVLFRTLRVVRKKNREYIGALLGMFAMSLTITMGPSYKPFWILLMMVFLQPVEWGIIDEEVYYNS